MIHEDRPMLIVHVCLCLVCRGCILQLWQQKVENRINVGKVGQSITNSQLVVLIYMTQLFFFIFINIYFGSYKKLALCKYIYGVLYQ